MKLHFKHFCLETVQHLKEKSRTCIIKYLGKENLPGKKRKRINNARENQNNLQKNNKKSRNSVTQLTRLLLSVP